MNCSNCSAPTARFTCACCNKTYCNAQCANIAAGMAAVDPRDFPKIEEAERNQRRELGFKLATIRGPHVLLYFNYGGAQFYLFGEDHDRQPPSDALDIEMDIKQGRNILMVNNKNSTSEMSIERFFLALFSDPKRLQKDIYLEIMQKAESVKPKRSTVYKGSHLEKLFHLFRESLEYGNNTIPNERNIAIHPVDFRVGNRELGIGSITPPYICFFSLYFQLFKRKKYDWNVFLFQTDENPNWDMELLDITLFGNHANNMTFEEYYFNFRKRFEELYREHLNDDDLKYFWELPAMNPTIAPPFNVNGVSLQAELFLRLPPPVQNVIYDMCHAKVQHVTFDYYNMDRMLELYGQMDSWYMDVPAMAKMLLQATPNSHAFGYFGSDHITHMTSIAAQLDPYFEMWADSMNGIGLPVHVEETFNALIVK